MLRSRIGLHRMLGLVPKIAGCKTPVSFDFPPVRLHSCLSADTVPLKGRTVWLDCGSCLLQSVTSSGGV